MWRYWMGGAAVLLLALAGLFLVRSGGASAAGPKLPVAPAVIAAGQQADPPLPDEAPSASQRTREQKRFDRYDKDRDGNVTRDEYLAARRKAFAKLDRDGDGRLSFDEWAAKSITKFTGADGDRSNTLNRGEFATTAPKRKARPACACAPRQRSEATAPDKPDGEE